MSEEQILNAIANYCQNDRLVFQVIVRDIQAHIYINRQSGDRLDYSQLTDNIVAAVADIDYLNITHIPLFERAKNN